MVDYELVLIFSSKGEESNQKELTKKISQTIKSAKGSDIKVDVWGAKEFAYPIAKQTQGLYLQFNFSLEPKNIVDLEKKLKSYPEILRYLLIKKDKRKEK